MEMNLRGVNDALPVNATISAGQQVFNEVPQPTWVRVRGPDYRNPTSHEDPDLHAILVVATTYGKQAGPTLPSQFDIVDSNDGEFIANEGYVYSDFVLPNRWYDWANTGNAYFQEAATVMMAPPYGRSLERADTIAALATESLLIYEAK